MNNYSLTEDIKLADEEEHELRTLFEDKESMIYIAVCSTKTLGSTDVPYSGVGSIAKQEKHIFNRKESK